MEPATETATPQEGEIIAPGQAVKRHNGPRHLTLKQLDFAACFAQTGKSTECYIKAGYNIAGMKQASIHRAAHELLSNPKVQERINTLRARMGSSIEVTTRYILEALVENAETALGRRPLKRTVFGEDGVARIEEVIAPDRSVANRALELLGKTKAMFVDRQETGSAGEFARLKDQELLDYIQREVAELKALPPPDDIEPVAEGVTNATEELAAELAAESVAEVSRTGSVAAPVAETDPPPPTPPPL